MNASIVWRLVWKEYRVLRGFWIALACMTLIAQLYILVRITPADGMVVWLFSCAAAAPAFYALGCGATMFATEYEEGTVELLRALSAPAGPVAAGKLVAAVGTTALLWVVLWLAATWMAGGRLIGSPVWIDGSRSPGTSVGYGLLEHWGLAAAEGLLWGILFSLIVKRPLLAACLGATAASVTVHGIIWTMHPGATVFMTLTPYLEAAPYRIGLAAALGVVDIWLAQRWLRPPAGIAASGAAVGTAISDRLSWRQSKTGEIFGRLVWHQLRQSAGTTAALIGIGLTLVLTFCWTSATNLYALSILAGVALPIQLLVVLPIIASLVGSTLFLPDKRADRFRFLVEHGVRPTHYWLSRQFAGIGVLILCACVVRLTAGIAASLALVAGVPGSRAVLGQGQVVKYVTIVGSSFGAIVLAYASGQLCGMFFRSGLLAGLSGLVLTALTVSWSALMIALGVGWTWSVLPIPLVLLLASWLRTRDWMLERSDLPARLRAVLVLALPTATLLVAVAVYRVYEVPDVDPGFKVSEFSRPLTHQERATADMYRRAVDLFVRVRTKKRAVERGSASRPEPDETVEAWLANKNKESVEAFLKASAQPQCAFYDPARGASELRVWYGHLVRFLLDSGRQLERNGQLDEAFERYLAVLRFSAHLRKRATTAGQQNADLVERDVYDRLVTWAAAPGQSSDRLLAAIRTITAFQQGLPARANAIEADYLLLERIARADPEAMAAVFLPGDQTKMIVFRSYLPWERARALRALRAVTAAHLRSTAELESKLGSRAEGPYWRRGLYDRSSARPPPYRWLASSYLGMASRWTSYHWLTHRMGWPASEVRIETRRRAILVLLALKAWQLEHGQYPAALDQLAGTYLEQLPLDPYSGGPFVYRPEGFSMVIRTGVGSSAELTVVPAGTPVFWSVGNGREIEIPDFTDGEAWVPASQRGSKHRIGWLFPLP